MKRIAEYWGTRRVLVAILGIGLLLRLGVLLLYLSTHDWKGEVWEYEHLANHLLQGEGFTIAYHYGTYRALVVPVFPILCALLHLIGGPGLGLYFVFHVATAMGIIWLTYSLAERFLGRPAAVLSAFLVMLEPGLVIYESYKVDPVTLSTLFLLLGVYLFHLMGQRGGVRLAASAGMVMGIGILTRPDLMALFGLIGVWAVQRSKWSVGGREIVVMTTTALLMLSPWVFRNYMFYDRILLTTTSAEVLWRGNNPNSSGTSLTLEGIGQLEAAPQEFRDKISSTTEIENYTLFKGAAISFIQADPVAFCWRAVKRLYYFFWFTPTFALWYSWVPDALLGVYRLFHAAVLGLAMVGVFYVIRGRRPGTIEMTAQLLTIVFLVAVIHSIGYVEGRHRILVMPVILIFTAQGCLAILSLIRPFAQNMKGVSNVRWLRTNS